METDIYVYMIRLKSILQEQKEVSSKVRKAYAQLVEASAGPGTDPDAIFKAFLPLNKSETWEVIKQFRDKKSGYSTFVGMINGEYDFNNGVDIRKLIATLYDRGWQFAASTGMTRSDYTGHRTYYTGTFKFVGPVKPLTPKDRIKDPIEGVSVAELRRAGILDY